MNNTKILIEIKFPFNMFWRGVADFVYIKDGILYHIEKDEEGEPHVYSVNTDMMEHFILFPMDSDFAAKVKLGYFEPEKSNG